MQVLSISAETTQKLSYDDPISKEMQTDAFEKHPAPAEKRLLYSSSALCTPACLATYLLPCVIDATVQLLFVFIHIHFKDKKAKILERASQSPDLKPTGNSCTEFKTVWAQKGP